MPFTPYTLPISLTAVATGGGVTPKSMSGLRNKTVYNSSGTSYTTPSSGPFSLKDNLLNRSFTAPYTVPNIVNPISATAGNAQVTLSWSAPNDGGSAITGYTLTYIPGGSVPIQLPSTSTSYIVTGLTNGTAYTFTMTANNIAGSSALNSSDSVTPIAPINPVIFNPTYFQNAYTFGSQNQTLAVTTGYTYQGTTYVCFSPHTIGNQGTLINGDSTAVYLSYSYDGTVYRGYPYVYLSGNGKTYIYNDMKANIYFSNGIPFTMTFSFGWQESSFSGQGLRNGVAYFDLRSVAQHASPTNTYNWTY